jgi:hypothetical protein
MTEGVRDQIRHSYDICLICKLSDMDPDFGYRRSARYPGPDISVLLRHFAWEKEIPMSLVFSTSLSWQRARKALDDCCQEGPYIAL